MNPQSTGTVTLASSNPSDAPIIDPRLASHPYDRRVMIEGYKKLVKLLKAPVFEKDTVRLLGPSDTASEDEIWVCFAISGFGEVWEADTAAGILLNDLGELMAYVQYGEDGEEGR